ncbi:MAG: hypothetical protein EBX40_08070, partial [Gammaproteobacteria bacterium]|nr:hypothetical protein [Gammaproteobacteria bacterium]
ESIIKMVQEKVRQHFGVDLHPEVKFIGEKLS